MSATPHAGPSAHDGDHGAFVPPARYVMPGKVRNAALGLLLVGAALLGAGFASEPWRGFANGLVASWYFVSVAVGALVIVALMHVTRAGWGIVLRRVPEAIASYMPVGLVTMLGFAGLGMHELYEWSHPDIVAKDALLQHKSVLLNPTMFVASILVFVGLWSIFAWAMRRHSVQQDATGDLRHTRANAVLGVVSLLVLGLTLTVGSLLWLMSIEPHWFSTMFGVYQFAGAHVAGVAATTLFVVGLSKGGFLPQVNDNHLHDLGKMMFAFATFWAYIWLGQFLLIWYSNIPEETGYYLLRYDHGWMALFAVNVVVNWAIPFLVLLPRPNKRNPKVLVPIAILILAGHWLDCYLQVLPGTSHFYAHHAGVELHGPPLGLAELGAMAAVGGLFLWVVSWTLTKAELVPTRDPYLQESLHHHQ